MCQLCLDAVAKHYPGLSETETNELLMNATAFPFGSPEQIDRQLAHLKAETDGTLDAAFRLSAKEFDRDWAEHMAQQKAETEQAT